MKKLFLVLGVLLVATSPFSAMGQGVIPLMPGGDIGPGFGPGMPGPGMGMPWTGSGSRQRFSDEMWRVNSYARIGPAWFNLTFDSPFNVPPVLSGGQLVPRFNFESIRLTISQEPYWVGFVGLELQPAPDFIVYSELGGNMKRDGAEAYMEASGRAFLPADPNGPNDSPPNTTSPWIWKINNFQWWMIDSGVAYKVNSIVAVEAGFRVEHFDFKLVDPRNFTTPLPGDPGGGRPITRLIVAARMCPEAVGSAYGDPLEKTWIPYLGIRGVGRRCCGNDCKGRPLTTVEYKWRLRGSPLAWNHWRDPMTLSFFCPRARVLDDGTVITATEVNQALYTMNGRYGLFLDADLEGLMPLNASLAANFWLKGTWLSFSGQPVSLDFTTLNQGTVPPGSEIFGAIPGSATSNEGSFQRSIYSLGVSLDLNF